MKFQILHESRGRVRLRAVQRSMSLREADLLEAWIRTLPGVDQVTVHERICGVTILFTGEQDALYSALSRFSYEEAEEETHVLSPHSREINREYKEMLVFNGKHFYPSHCFSKPGADPGRQGGDRRENNKQLQQLAFEVEAVLPSLHHMRRLGVVMLEEVEFQKQKVVDEGHVADLINR